MAKLIGKGKDPRAPKGVDFDVPDDEVEDYKAIGDEIHLPEDMAKIHAAEKIIKSDPQKEAEVEAEDAGGNADRVASRIESTSSQPRGASGSRKGSSEK